MSINQSKFLKESRTLLKELITKLNETFEYVSVLGTDCIGKSYFINKMNTRVSSSNFNERGFVIRVYDDGMYYEYSCNEISRDNMHEILDKIKLNVLNLREKDTQNIRHKNINEQSVSQSMIKDVEINPIALGDKLIIEKIKKLRNKGLKQSPYIINFSINYNFLQVNKIFLSDKKDLEQSYMWADCYAFCIAEKDNKNKYYFDTISGLKGVEILDELENKIDDTVNVTLSLLDSEPIKPGEYDVIFDPEMSGLIAHEAFGHGVEMDMFVKNRAEAKNVMGQRIASSLVTMIDGAKGIEQTSSYIFDDEGTLAGETVVIDKGILKSGLNDCISATELNATLTGNGKRESFERKAYSRMTNTYFKPGESTLDEMIKSINYGFLLEGAGSGMEDPKNWGIQCMALVAREIKEGKITGKIYSPIILTGYVPDVLKKVSMISKEFGIAGAGFCGKGYKEFVKVSCGGPYMKSKVRLG